MNGQSSISLHKAPFENHAFRTEKPNGTSFLPNLQERADKLRIIKEKYCSDERMVDKDYRQSNSANIACHALNLFKLVN
ncbi:uncharacterized protein J3R85_007879 [Psidium guajava]|nr:uncharacterized protein J3R85_007879 [Psidium guajava]